MQFNYNYIYHLLVNNKLITKYKYKKIVTKRYDHDFSFLYFFNKQKLSKILNSNIIKFNIGSENFYNYHSFNWVALGKNIGGSEMVGVTRDKIIIWAEKYNKIYLHYQNIDLVGKRILNLIYNYDFYGSSAYNTDKDKINYLIYYHYCFLKKFINIKKNSKKCSIEIQKSILLFEAIHNINTGNTINYIERTLTLEVNTSGMHVSLNPELHSEFINHLIEIKNIALFFKLNFSSEIDYFISRMISVLKNFIHKDGSLAYFNGSTNLFMNQINKIINIEKDIKFESLTDSQQGLLAYENKNIKIIFDTAKPNKDSNFNYHASTLSFELSIGKEKIITNCGSLNNKQNNESDYLRYSAAHSTIILNNTNISELTKKKPYIRSPSKIFFDLEENTNMINWKASHDGYEKIFKKIVRRQIQINKNKPEIQIKDEIIPTGIKKNKILFNIRVHLTPICNAILTRGKMSAIIKTNNSSYVLKCNNKIGLEESICIDGKNKIVKTTQIVVSGFTHNEKKTINWSITQY